MRWAITLAAHYCFDRGTGDAMDNAYDHPKKPGAVLLAFCRGRGAATDNLTNVGRLVQRST